MKQTTDTVVMVSPDYFSFNAQTAKTNVFQYAPEQKNITELALAEFLLAVKMLTEKKIHVIVLPSTIHLTPDAVFPNNWFSTHVDKEGKTTLVLYPMLTPNRQAERQPQEVISHLIRNHITITKVIDLTHYDQQKRALEGTGAMVLDHENRIAYIALSPRSDRGIVNELLPQLDYKPFFFESVDEVGKAIYHTNVMMSVGVHFAVVCLESIVNLRERKMIIQILQQTGKDIIDISWKQMRGMAGNILEMHSYDNLPYIFLSETAFNAFSSDQRERLSKHGTLSPIPIAYIERVGGGSVRCMLAEIFYKK